MGDKRGGPGSRQEGVHRLPQGVRRSPRGQTLLWGWGIRLRRRWTRAFLQLVLHLRDLWQLQHWGRVPQAHRLGQEVHGERECVQVPACPKKGLWPCFAVQKDDWVRVGSCFVTYVVCNKKGIGCVFGFWKYIIVKVVSLGVVINVCFLFCLKLCNILLCIVTGVFMTWISADLIKNYESNCS